MAVSYTQSLSTEMIIGEIEALIDWRHSIVRRCFYPDYPSIHESRMQAPDTLLHWCRNKAASGQMDKNVLQRLESAYEDLNISAEQYFNAAAGGKRPAIDMYDTLENQCVSYVNHLRRLQQDVFDSGMSVDGLTGLRTVSGMYSDIKKEQDRFDRKGTPFSIARVEIDDNTKIQGSYDRFCVDKIFASVGVQIGKMVRSFDDAYYLGGGEYLIVIKHVDFKDACAVVDRMRVMIEKTPITLPDGRAITVTASFGIAESMPREKTELTIDNAKGAMRKAQELGGNRVIPFLELSVLEQLKRELKEKEDSN